jgi:flagellar biogenesis protein FliO
MLIFYGLILNLLLNNITLNVNDLGSATRLVVIGVKYRWLVITINSQWSLYSINHS